MLVFKPGHSLWMPHGYRLADEVAGEWGFQCEDAGGRRLKVFERIALAIWLTRHWSAEELLAFEAEHTDLGHRVVGMRAGAKVLLGNEWARLDAVGIALLLAVADAPGRRRDPWCFPDGIRTRRDWILKRMRETGVLSPEETDTALRTPLALALRPSEWEPCPIPGQQPSE
ncbi:transglycosylase domain-containing protein [Pyxidicoccus parkwayensis]|nr:transglycosylase domain-containing protein [Pyxidicoccus parkwaysis]